jgi:general secretion pathway protein D
LAGLINDQDQRSANNVPGLGDIPILGRLFGSTLRDGKKTEIVLSITPHIIRNIKPLNAGDSEFLSGTENSLRRRPDFTPRPVPAVAPAVSAITKGQTLPAIAATNASAVDQAGKN